jgi:hypothetical protein
MNLNSFINFKLLCLAHNYLYSFADKVSDLKDKFPDFANDIQFLADNDPSGNQKYLTYAVKVLISKQALRNEILDVIKLFHKYQDKLDNKDINSYNFTDLRDKLFEIRDSNKKSKRQENNEIKVSGAVKKYEDDQCVVLLVKDKAAACFYGTGTKWCITMKNEYYFESYDSENTIFYFILRKDLPKEQPNYKIAVAYSRDTVLPTSKNIITDTQYFNAQDEGVGENEAFGNIYSAGTVKYVGLKNWKQIKQLLLTDVVIQPKSLGKKIQDGELSYEEVMQNIDNMSIQLALSELFPGDETGKKYLTQEVYEKLAESKIDKVIYNISHHNDLSENIIKKICLYDEQTAENITGNAKNITPEILKTIYNNFGTCQGFIIYNILTNIRCPSEILTDAYNKRSDEECFNEECFGAIILNPNTPIEILKDIAFNKTNNIESNIRIMAEQQFHLRNFKNKENNS